MRTTVTIDPDVEVLLKRAMGERGITFKDALNSGLRAALGQPAPKRDFRQQTFGLGPELHFRWDKALAMADALEDEELTRKLSLRK